MSDLLANFFCLDELIQVIYQGFDKFVVLSSVDDSEWKIHVGLSGRNGRWWRGRWTENEFTAFFGSKLSEKILEMSAEKLMVTFVQGDLFISDWSPDKDANIKFTLGPASKKPLHIALTELTTLECIEYTTSVLTGVARQASQSWKCKLHPCAPIIQTDFGPSRSENLADPGRQQQHSATELLENKSSHKSNIDVKMHARDSINKRIGDNQAMMPTSDPKHQTHSSKTVLPKKGASLANPNKKARKYQAIEFGSDDE